MAHLDITRAKNSEASVPWASSNSKPSSQKPQNLPHRLLKGPTDLSMTFNHITYLFQNRLII